MKKSIALLLAGGSLAILAAPTPATQGPWNVVSSCAAAGAARMASEPPASRSAILFFIVSSIRMRRGEYPRSRWNGAGEVWFHEPNTTERLMFLYNSGARSAVL